MPRSKRRALLAMLSLLGTIALAGCLTPWPPTETAATAASPTAPAADSRPQVCTVWKIVRYSKDDTADTVEQVRENNAARRTLCGEDPTSAGPQ
jgi:hypothetical protein